MGILGQLACESQVYFTVFVLDVLEVIESLALQDHELVILSGRIVILLYHEFSFL